MLQRLKELRQTLGYNQTNFAKFLGISQTAYSMIENGIHPLAEKYIKVICLTFNTNESWLKTGEGEMFRSSQYEKELVDLFLRLTPATQQFLLLMAKELLNTQQQLLGSEE